MSSPPYSTDLPTEPLLRRVVLWSGIVLLLVGVVVIAGLPLPGYWGLIAVGVWVAAGSRELLALAGAYRRYRALRIYSDGSIEVRREDASTASARLLPGSIVLPRLAWLRLRLEGGPTSGELLRGDTGENEAWRRLQVIWRHMGGAL
jgi:hypothetical protein